MDWHPLWNAVSISAVTFEEVSIGGAGVKTPTNRHRYEKMRFFGGLVWAVPVANRERRGTRRRFCGEGRVFPGPCD